MAPRTALLLIDFLNRLDFEGAERLRMKAFRAAAATARLKRQARAKKIPCIYVNDHYGQWSCSFEEVVRSVETHNAHAAKLVAFLRPEARDIPILKPRHSGFYGTPLEFLLEELRVKRLILTGLATDNCVFATAQDAFVRKFELWIPSNCVASETGSGESGVLKHMARTMKARVNPYRARLWPS